MDASPEGQTQAQGSLGSVLAKALLTSAVVFALLECWRPYFFLTDDNLDGGFPFLTDVGRNLLAGRSPFISSHLFGGHYDFLHDPSYFVWHPFYLLVSLLAGTPFHNAIIDVDAFGLYLLATTGFVVLACHLRREMALEIGDGWIVFFSLSYTYSMIALATGASWLTFLGDHSALPWLTFGILQKTFRRGIGLVLLFSLHMLLGGHLSPTVSSTLFLSIFAVALSITQRSWLPVANWFIGYAIAVVIISPLLIPMLQGFLGSGRSQGLTLEDMQANNIPGFEFPTSLFMGMALWILTSHEYPHATYTLALGGCIAAWCLLPALATRAKWRPLEIITMAMMVFIGVLVCRPVWITEIMMQLPLFRSMRWPFRELLEFQLFLHLFLVIRRPGLTLTARKFSAILGTFMMVFPMLLFPLAPTFNQMTWDRELILNGGAERYWEQVRPLLQPTDRIAVLIPLDVYDDDRFDEPYSLLGTYNYAAIDGIVNAWGYSPTLPRNQAYTKTYAFYPFGAYLPSQKQALMAERPELKFITLESLRPLRITLSSRDGPTIDLTPYVPPRLADRNTPIPAQ